MTDCPFCDRIERHKYDEGDQWTVTFEPLNPVTPGHRLFVPRIHVTDALDSPDLAGEVMRYAAQWADGHNTGPCNLITSAGPSASQTVFHYLHLIPRREGDGLVLPWTGQKKRPSAPPYTVHLSGAHTSPAAGADAESDR